MVNNSTKSTNSTPTIAVVIPIYNVAPYLRECLDSVLSQSYQNFHVALINDGSTDESLDIAKEYVKKDSRFVLLDKENGGQSQARNVGIDYFANNLEIGGGQQANFNPYNIKQIYTYKNLNSSLRDSTITIIPPKVSYLIFLDPDDYWEKDCLQSCIDAFSKAKKERKNLQEVWFNEKWYFENKAHKAPDSTLFEQ